MNPPHQWPTETVRLRPDQAGAIGILSRRMNVDRHALLRLAVMLGLPEAIRRFGHHPPPPSAARHHPRD